MQQRLDKLRHLGFILSQEGEFHMKLGQEINWALDQLAASVASNNAKDQEIASLQAQVTTNTTTTQDQEDKDAIARLDTTFTQNNPAAGNSGNGAVPAAAPAVNSSVTGAASGTTNISVGA